MPLPSSRLFHSLADRLTIDWAGTKPISSFAATIIIIIIIMTTNIYHFNQDRSNRKDQPLNQMNQSASVSPALALPDQEYS